MVYALFNAFFNTWIGHLIIILFGYSTIFIPGYFFIKYIKKIQYIDKADSSFISQFIVLFAYGKTYDKIGDDVSHSKLSRRELSSSLKKCGQLICCIIGLQVSYLTWGILQEKIMTKEYVSFGGSYGQFKDSQFLVFVNRILAFCISGVYLLFTKQPRHSSPIYKYSYCSFSNIMSSWFQYEALKYVSFPTQVLAKASKIIPTMLMGKVVSGKKYEYYEYLTAFLISVGMVMFLLTSSFNYKNAATATTLSGALLLVGYMCFDAFTSNWQGALFASHGMSSVQMMCGVNFFSCLLTGVSLLQQSVFGPSLKFMVLYPAFFWDCIVLSVCSACGQLFIFYTISTFGPVVFVIIMTVRQGLAILLSCLIYLHPVAPIGVLGIAVMFGAVFLRIYCSYRLKQHGARRSSAGPAEVQIS